MKKKKVMVKAVVDMIVWVQEDAQGDKEIIDIEDITDIEEFEEKYIYEEIEY